MNHATPTKSKQNYGTPWEVFNPLHDVFCFQLDVCAEYENAKLPRYYTEKDDGLSKPWAGVNWCNPPYARPGPWLEKAFGEAQADRGITACLIKADTSTRWWNTWVRKGRIYLATKRIRFAGGAGGVTFPSALVVFCPNLLHKGAHYGYVGQWDPYAPWEDSDV